MAEKSMAEKQIEVVKGSEEEEGRRM